MMDLYTAPFSCPVASLLIPLMEVNHSRGTRWNYLKGGMPLATAHIIPIHINKSKTLAQCLSDRMGYGENPEKTNGGEYHAVIDGQTHGPFSETTMITMAAEGNLSRESLVWKPGMPDWTQACKVRELQKIFPPTPPPMPPENSRQ